MTTAQMPTIYRRFATAIGPEHWQGAVARQEAAIRSNPFLAAYLRSEYAIAYQLEKLRVLVAARGDVPPWAFHDRSIFPALAFAAQVLGVLNLCTTKQARTFVKRVKTAFSNSENMHGLRRRRVARVGLGGAAQAVWLQRQAGAFLSLRPQRQQQQAAQRRGDQGSSPGAQ